MASKQKKILKVVSISIVSFLLIILAIISFAIYFIFTPAKLTPVVLKLANESLNARLDIQRVELTFFSTFPQFGLSLKEGTLVSRSLRNTDSIPSSAQDSLLSFKECVVTVDPLGYLRNNQISIHNILLREASVYAFRNESGRSNWDILKTTSNKASIEKDTTSVSTFDSEIDIRNIELKNANLIVDDRTTEVYTRVEDVNLRIKASFTASRSVLSLNFSNKNLLFWQQGQLLANKISTSLNTHILMDRQTLTYELKNTSLTINGIRLDANGVFIQDTVAGTVDLDVSYGLHAPSVEKVLNMIPESLMKKSKVNAKGDVLVRGELKGLYGEKHLPAASLNIQIKDVSAQYAGFPYGIDRASAEFDLFVDLMRTKPSYANLKLFRFQGAHTDIFASLRLDNLLTNPLISFNTKTTADLGALAQTFPWQEGIKLGGILHADLQLQCRLSEIKNQDVGRIKLSGELGLKDILVQDSLKSFDLSSDASFRFNSNNSLQAEAEISRLLVKSKILSSSIERMSATITSSNPKDSTRIVELACRLDMNKLQARLHDSITFYTGRTQATLTLAPGKKNVAQPRLGVSFRTDSVYLRAQDTHAALGTARFDFQVEKDSLWLPEGEIEFNKMIFYTPEFKLPVRVGATVVSLDEKDLILHNAQLKIGNSDLEATGSVGNIYGAWMHKGILKARLDIRSNYLDCNELLGALSVSSDTLVADGPNEHIVEPVKPLSESESSQMKLFVIPENIDFELRTHAGKVTFDKMVFENINSIVQVKDQAVYLSDLSMRALEADMNAVVVYKATSPQRAFTGFDFSIQNINVGKLVDFIPTLDTIVPMLRSFKGLVNFNVALESQLDSTLSISIPTLKSAINIQGDSLVLMDGETFAEIAKMLMFKNEKENVFDRISVNITVNDGKVTVYPFLVEIDRYKAAVGGSQGLDMNFNYHISILQSPLPFKAGVNISGNLDKMKFRIGKAKYKDAVSPAEVRKVDSTRVHLGKEITDNFMKLWR